MPHGHNVFMCCNRKHDYAVNAQIVGGPEAPAPSHDPDSNLDDPAYVVPASEPWNRTTAL